MVTASANDLCLIWTRPRDLIAARESRVSRVFLPSSNIYTHDSDQLLPARLRLQKWRLRDSLNLGGEDVAGSSLLRFNFVVESGPFGPVVVVGSGLSGGYR